MIVGVPTETKDNEHRVSLTPDKVDLLVSNGHSVLVQSKCGERAAFTDEDYEAVGAIITDSTTTLYDEADLIVKVKEPQPTEFELFHENQILFTYLHLAPDPKLTTALLTTKVTGIAYETVQDTKGNLPLLYPMSEIAGMLSPQIASHLLCTPSGGPGRLLGEVPGAQPMHMAILGGGTVGINAALMAASMGARVSILDINLERLRYIQLTCQPTIETVIATPKNVQHTLSESDVVVGAVLVPGATAPKVINSDVQSHLRKGTLIMDIAIDQGGCVENIQSTTHSAPTYTSDGLVYYAVPNVPGSVAHTASISLSNATYPYVLSIANNGIIDLIKNGHLISSGLNTFDGYVTHQAIAKSLSLECVPADQLITK